MADPCHITSDKFPKLPSDISGQRRGKLTVVRFLEMIRKGKRSTPCFLIKCDCGNEFRMRRGNFLHRKSGDCGCEKLKTRSQPKGAWHHPLYKTWNHIFERCDNPNDKSFANYGGRGIKICDLWRHGDGTLTGFERFCQDMGPRPTPLHTIERVDNSKGYEPGNCIWANRTVQGNNKRNNLHLTHDGRTLTPSQWSRETGLKYFTIIRRMEAGLSDAEVLTRPLRYP